MTYMCSMVREVSTVMGFPRGCYSPECGVPLSDREAYKLIAGGNHGVMEGREVEVRKMVKGDECLSLEFMRKGIDGIVVEYDSEVGAIL